ncbi:MAG: undecaprenyl/decaprenyl-phosphate alpha-N-acetylglucosaminyl 1-phosphate transferase [Thermoleophilaceae bacterium]|nr:undecaprenyl/decaprenyl-phosphate alpha-N-acetylglucosaminyl 1-phosphate transferase [Thermoleophilaceae bacterium]
MNELDALWAFLVAGALALVATPIAASLAHRVGAIDRPGDRSLHASPTPSLGGLAILAGVLLAGAIFLPWSQETRAILGGGALITLIGAVDDALDGGLSPVLKLAGQLAAALVPVLAEVRVENMTVPFVDPLDLGDWGIPLTLLGMVAVMNVVNFTDGVDGLAAGVCTIAAATFAIIALSLDRIDAGVLAAATAGASIGFLRHNFHPASVFMGDSGSNLLGFLLAVIAIQGVLKTAAVVALFFPLVILAVPALDATFVVAKRIKHGIPVYSADRSHFHHRFANIGFSQRRTVLYLYAWTVSLAALALALRFVPYSEDDGTLNAGWAAVMAGFGLLAFAASLYLVLVLEILKFRRFRERQLRKQALSEQEIEEEIAREVETGEFEALKPPG